MALKSAPRASLAPSDHFTGGGGAVPDGEYVMTARTGLFTYPGKDATVPAILVNYVDAESGTEYEKKYKAGDTDHLEPTEDGTGFVHPDHQTSPQIFGDGEAHYWLQSIEAAGFEIADVPAGVKQFDGMKVRLKTKMIKLGKERKDTPVALVDKIVDRPTGKKLAGAKPAASGTAKSSAPAASNGALDEVAMELVKEALAKGPLAIPKLAMNVWFAANKTDHKPDAQAIKTLVSDPKWLEAHEFMTDGESVGMG